jgi:histidinol-phosphate/aromatic aminotransferase/cobyric acid decarboxylase-like protein
VSTLPSHGGLQETELRALQLKPEEVLDFSASTNPYGPDPQVVRALRGAAIARYPDPFALFAREALGEGLGGVPATEIVLGNGAAELLWTLARCLLQPGQRALIAEPTFSEFRAAVRCAGASAGECRGSIENDFAIDLHALSEQARRESAPVVYLCSPNTPTGTALGALEISHWASAHPELTVVLDQSFLSLSECWADAEVRMPQNVICVRSLTKDHGIPGVRVGYMIARPELCRAAESCRPAWSTSAFAQVAALACAGSASFVRESRERLLEDRRELGIALQSLGIEPLPSCTNFLMARMPHVTALRGRLLAEHRISIRDCASFGLPGFARFAARSAPDRQRLLDALRTEALRVEAPLHAEALQAETA